MEGNPQGQLSGIGAAREHFLFNLKEIHKEHFPCYLKGILAPRTYPKYGTRDPTLNPKPSLGILVEGVHVLAPRTYPKYGTSDPTLNPKASSCKLKRKS